MRTQNDSITLTIGGLTHATWDGWSVESDLLVPADAFELELYVKDSAALPSVLVEGASCTLNLGRDRVLTGQIDEFEHDVNRQGVAIRINGRDGAAALVDCSCPFVSLREASLLTEALPSCPDGFVWGLVGNEPTQLEDHRGPVYSTTTGAKQEWSSVGELPEGVTSVPFPGPFHVWHVNAWRLDTVAQTDAKSAEVLTERDDLLRVSQLRIAPLQYAHEIGDPTEKEQAALIDWKRYSIELNRIEQQDGFPLAITWPVVPA